jgi:hypothetical protein
MSNEASAEESALREIKAAKADMAKANEEIEHGLNDMKEADHELERANADLEEARRHSHMIHFTLEGEPEEAERRDWTPNQIITDFGGRDPANNYLVEIQGDHQKSFRGMGDTPIKLHDCERLQIISIGPTPVSHE